MDIDSAQPVTPMNYSTPFELRQAMKLAFKRERDAEADAWRRMRSKDRKKAALVYAASKRAVAALVWGA